MGWLGIKRTIPTEHNCCKANSPTEPGRPGECTTFLGADRDLWRMLIGDRDKSGRIGAPGYLQSVFEDVKRAHMTERQTLRLEYALEAETGLFSREYLHLAEGIVWNRAMIEVDSTFGLALQNAQIGDLVVILKGCSVPVVLRTRIVMGVEEEEVTQCTVIRDCYMDGLMLNGKAIRGREDLQIFVFSENHNCHFP